MSAQMRAGLRSLTGLLLLAGLSFLPPSALAEWYVAGQAGYSFADSIRTVTGTGGLSGFDAPDFDLKNSFAYGGKVGVFPFHGSIGFELDVFQSTPHVKNLDEIPGIHLAVTNIGANVLLRYPGVTFQPYVGFGPAILIARLGSSDTTQQDTQVSVGVNALAGLRAFVMPKVALFTEYKYTSAKLGFDDAFGSVGGFEGNYYAHQLFVGLSYHF